MTAAFPACSALAADVCPSPNFGARKDGKRVDAIILHYTGMASGGAALDLLCSSASEVSCHYLVWEDGRDTQLVPEALRAWHAGRGLWAGESDMNSRSIGIEIVNPGHADGKPQNPMPLYPAKQIKAVTALCADICARLAIAAPRVLAHSDIAPARKIDPGERFPWARLAKAGVGHWVKPPPPGANGAGLKRGDSDAYVELLQRLLVQYGYGLAQTGDFDAETETVLRAFQRHFRPARVDGVADRSTFVTLRRLVAGVAKG